MKDAIESIPCEVYSMDDLQKYYNGEGNCVHVLSRDNVHTWARENGGPIEITDEMLWAGWSLVSHCPGLAPSHVRAIYAAMEAKRREGK